MRQLKDVEEPLAETRATESESGEEDGRPGRTSGWRWKGDAATIGDPDIGLGVNSCFTRARELCFVRCTEGDALRCGRGVGWYCRHRAGNFIVSIMPTAHLNSV